MREGKRELFGEEKDVDAFENMMSERFKSTFNPVAETYMGLCLSKGRNKTCYVNLYNHIVNGFEQHRLEVPKNKLETPMNKDLIADDTNKLYAEKEYQQIVGLLNYITVYGRPEMSFSIHMLSTKLKNPTQCCLEQSKRALMYLFKTKNKKLKYEALKDSENVLYLLTDSSYANGENRKSVFGNIILLNENIIFYRSKTEPIVTTSSTEAEYVGISCSIKDLRVSYNLLKELKVDFRTVILIDNQPALRLCKGEIATGRLKHLDTRYKYVAQEVLAMKAELQYVQTSENWSDIMTKLCGKNMFSKFLDRFYVN
eukprot:snap_masked-scaffold_2-processed-gene-27.53-mRNA-1 protein AED:0.39 eAED:0.39 QI:0/0/0/0.5/1/1/2/0/312